LYLLYYQPHSGADVKRRGRLRERFLRDGLFLVVLKWTVR
jgi:hypothetical protein